MTKREKMPTDLNAHAVSLHFMHDNFAQRHQTLKGATPAMAAGIERHPWSLTQLANCWTKTRERDPTDSHLRVARGG